MRFCRENMDKERKWTLDPSTISVKDNRIFSATITEEGESPLELTVYQLYNGAIRIRVDPIKEEDKSFRYDLSKNDFIVDQRVINNRAKIGYTKTQEEITLTCNDDIKVKIVYNTLVIKITQHNKEIASLNSKNLMVSEHNRNKKIPDEKFEEFVETVPNGPTSVGIDVNFPGSNTRISGIPEQVNYMNYDDGQFRRYNLDYASAYGNVPVFYAHSPNLLAGVFWCNPSDTFYQIKTLDDYRQVRVLSEGGYLDLFFFAGSMDKMIDQYTEITGRTALPQMFTLGYHQCKYGYKDQPEIEDIITHFETIPLPMDCFWIDIDHLRGQAPFIIDYKNWPDLPKVFQRLADTDRFMVRICDPHLPVTWEDHFVYNQGKEVNAYIKNPDGSDFVGDSWPGACSWPDYMDPKVRDWYKTEYRYNNPPDQSAPNVFFWNDMNEPSVDGKMDRTFPKDSTHNDKIELRETHGAYGVMNSATTYQGLLERNEDRNTRPFMLSRQFFSGTQRYAFSWTADIIPGWDYLQKSVSMAVNSMICGCSMTGSDLGGFNAPTNDNYMVRWFQAGAWLYSFFRNHADTHTPRREPYLYTGVTYECLVQSMKDRYMLLAVWYTAIYDNNQTGKSPVVFMWHEFPEVEELHDNCMQFILASTFLVVPVMTEENKVSIVKPPGKWYNFYNGEELTQSKTIEVTWYDTPVFIRAGRIAPLYYDIGMTTKETLTKPLTLMISCNSSYEAEGKIYLDDGKTFNFKKGEFLHRRFTFKDYTLKCEKIDVEGEKLIPENVKDSYIGSIVIYGGKDGQVVNYTGLHINIKNEWSMNIRSKNVILKESKIQSQSDNSSMTIILIISSIGILAIVIIAYFLRAPKNEKETVIDSTPLVTK